MLTARQLEQVSATARFFQIVFCLSKVSYKRRQYGPLAGHSRCLEPRVVHEPSYWLRKITNTTIYRIIELLACVRLLWYRLTGIKLSYRLARSKKAIFDTRRNMVNKSSPYKTFAPHRLISFTRAPRQGAGVRRI